MKSVYYFVLLVLAFFVASCDDNGTNPDVKNLTKSRIIEFYVTEIACPGSYNSYEYTDQVRAQCWFRTQDSVFEITVAFNSPEYSCVKLPYGEYSILIKSGRGYGLTELSEHLFVSDTGVNLSPSDTPWYLAPGASLQGNVLKIRNYAVVSSIDTISAIFHYSDTDSLGKDIELDLLNTLNEMTGNHIVINPEARSIFVSDEHQYLKVKYVLLVDPVLYVYEIIDQANAMVFRRYDIFPPILTFEPLHALVCLSK